MSVREMLRIRREERLPALLLLMVTTALNALFVSRLSPYMLHVSNRGEVMSRLLSHFHISGYDPFTLTMLSIWNVDYNPYRHPLYAFFIWPFGRLNHWLRHWLGFDCSLYIAAVLLTIMAIYGMIFLRRIFTDVMGLGQRDANLLTAFFYSMAYVMLMLCVPEHFPFSMFLLLLGAYVTGMCIKERRGLSVWQTVLLFVVTAGVSLSNGVKVFLAALFTRGLRRFVKPAYLLLAVLLPTVLIWAFADYEYQKMVRPRELVQQKVKVIKNKKEISRLEQEMAEAEQQGDSLLVAGFRASIKALREERYDQQSRTFDKWLDLETPRVEVISANLFGESVQLHQDYTLEDGLGARPLAVPYRWWLNDVVELFVVLLFLGGVWYGCRQRFLLLMLSWMAFDLLIHLVLGFGIKEVYIMSPHWLFVIPVAIAYLFLRIPSRGLRLAFLAVTLFLFVYNGYLLADYLL